MDRFTIQYDEHGVQLHNDYIDKIVNGIIEYYRRKNITLDAPEQCYGLLHRDRELLKAWERILTKERIL